MNHNEKLDLFSNATKSLVIEALEADALDEAYVVMSVGLATILAMCPERLSKARLVMLVTDTVPAVRADMMRIGAQQTAKAAIARMMKVTPSAGTL